MMGQGSFTYGRTYLERPDAFPIYEPERQLQSGPQFAADGNRLPLCLYDAMPDAWGRTVINYRLGTATREFGELTYMLNSGSESVGALDFQWTADRYSPRGGGNPSLEEVSTAAYKLQLGEPLSPQLDDARAHGSSLGGARPKALLTDGSRQMIAKFSSVNDTFPVVQGEFVAMELARLCGLNVAPVELYHAAGRYVLGVERFDRGPDGSRHRVVSALTILGLTPFPGGTIRNLH